MGEGIVILLLLAAFFVPRWLFLVSDHKWVGRIFGFFLNIGYGVWAVGIAASIDFDRMTGESVIVFVFAASIFTFEFGILVRSFGRVFRVRSQE
jgi:hypothetical protein